MSFALRSLTYPDILDQAVALAARQIGEPAFPEAPWLRDRPKLIASLKEVVDKEDLPALVEGYLVRVGNPVPAPKPAARIAGPLLWLVIGLGLGAAGGTLKIPLGLRFFVSRHEPLGQHREERQRAHEKSDRADQRHLGAEHDGVA